MRDETNGDFDGNAAENSDAIRKRQFHCRPGDGKAHLCQELADQAFMDPGFLRQVSRMRLVMGAFLAGVFL